MSKLYIVVAKDEKNKEYPIKSIMGIFKDKENAQNLYEKFDKEKEYYYNCWFDFYEIETDLISEVEDV